MTTSSVGGLRICREACGSHGVFRRSQNVTKLANSKFKRRQSSRWSRNVTKLADARRRQSRRSQNVIKFANANCRQSRRSQNVTKLANARCRQSRRSPNVRKLADASVDKVVGHICLHLASANFITFCGRRLCLQLASANFVYVLRVAPCNRSEGTRNRSSCVCGFACRSLQPFRRDPEQTESEPPPLRFSSIARVTVVA